jgi:hypothetical protein
LADEQTGAAPQLATTGTVEGETKPPLVASAGKPKRKPKPWWAWFMNVDHILAVVAIAAGVVSIVYERKVHHDVGNIAKNASTVYLPEWPEHTDDLTKLVSDFKSGDELLVDVEIGYTHFSHPKQFHEYFDALKNAVKLSSPKRPVKILMPDPATHIIEIQKQFAWDENDPGKRDVLELWKEEPWLFKEYCQEYAQYDIGGTAVCSAASSDAIPKPAIDPNDFYALLMYVESRLCSELLAMGNKVIIRKVNDVSLKKRYRHLWIRHRESLTGDRVMEGMILAYSRFYGPAKGKGYGWRTFDGHLIEVFWREFDEEFEALGKDAQLSDGDILYTDAVNKVKQQLKQ